MIHSVILTAAVSSDAFYFGLWSLIFVLGLGFYYLCRSIDQLRESNEKIAAAGSDRPTDPPPA